MAVETTRHVLAGYDGSRAAEHALRWAVEEARLRRRPLTICHAWRWPYPEIPAEVGTVATIRHMAELLLERAVSRAHSRSPGLAIRARLVTGPPTACLLNESHQADAIVLGAHGADGFPGLPAGSTAVQVAAHANRPTIVVRDVESPPQRVVVGVDGSPSSDAALAFAFEEATLRGWELEAVHAADPFGTEAIEHTAGALLERTVSPWREKYPQVTALTTLRTAEPRAALLSAAAPAGLLVVGDRGEGGLPLLRLGAVSGTVLRYAPCSVAVVHSRTRP